MLASIHIARKDLGLDEDNYRALLQAVTGKESCSKMTGPELNRVMDRFRGLGWKPKGGKGKKLSPKTRDKDKYAKTQIDKIRAMWLEAFNCGVVKDRYESGLNAFVYRMTKIQRVEWLLDSPIEANKVIEALKKMIERGGKDE